MIPVNNLEDTRKKHLRLDSSRAEPSRVLECSSSARLKFIELELELELSLELKILFKLGSSQDSRAHEFVRELFVLDSTKIQINL